MSFAHKIYEFVLDPCTVSVNELKLVMPNQRVTELN